MKNQVKTYLFVLFIIFSMTFTFFACKAEVEEPEPIPEPTYYTVTYVSEHGTAPEAISVLENAVLTEGQLAALSDGTMVFKGWYDGDVKAVAGEYHVTENVTLTAHWASTATVSYHSVFGDVPESFDVEVDQTLTATNLENITCSPYTFQGWFYSKDEGNNGTGIQAQADDPLTADTPLYAKWQTATVTFSTQFGNAPSVTKYTGTKIESSEIKTLSNTGYAFGGWFNGSTQLTTNYTVMSDVTFTARWTANTYIITFKANGGTGEDRTQTVTYGNTAKLDANAFSYTFASGEAGYFIKWNTAANGSGTSYSDKADYAVTETNDITLYAQWENISSKIQGMTESGTVVAVGSFSPDLIRQINSTLKSLPENVLVTLDLSQVTGLTELEAAKDNYDNVINENNSFYYCKNLAGIILPDSVKSIGRYAFAGCTNLTSITIPDSVTNIGSHVFSFCTSLTNVNIPNKVTRLDSTFNNCTSLTSITIPNSVTSLSDTFFKCKSLANVTIPDSVTYLSRTFSGCTSLTSITIPDSVTRIEMYTFYNCTSLTSIIFVDIQSKWYKTTFFSYEHGTEIGAMSSDAKANAYNLRDDNELGPYNLYNEKYRQ